MNDAKPDGELLTLDQAAAEVGWVGKYRWERMRRLLEGKEAALERPIMTRVGKRGDRKVTRGALRRHCAELFETSANDLARGFRKYLDEIDEKLDRRIDEHPTVQGLVRGQRQNAKNLNELAKRFARLV